MEGRKLYFIFAGFFRPRVGVERLVVSFAISLPAPSWPHREQGRAAARPGWRPIGPIPWASQALASRGSNDITQWYLQAELRATETTDVSGHVCCVLHQTRWAGGSTARGWWKQRARNRVRSDVHESPIHNIPMAAAIHGGVSYCTVRKVRLRHGMFVTF